MKRILIIKLGALGDFIQAFGPFQAVRQTYPDAHVALLTTRPFMELARAAPWFDAVLEDRRPRWSDVAGLQRLRHQLRGYDLVIDLQTSGRSTRYYPLAGRPRWSGLIKSDAFYHANPWRNEMHTIARQHDQLRYAGVTPVANPQISWLIGDDAIQTRDAGRFAVLVPGAAPHRPGKRWPVAHFSHLAKILALAGIQPIIVGSESERALAQAIRRECPQAQDLTSATDLFQLAKLLKQAEWVVGNDTGPLHLAAAVGTPATVIFSGESNPRLTAPIGVRPGQVVVCEAQNISTITVESVVATHRKSL